MRNAKFAAGWSLVGGSVLWLMVGHIATAPTWQNYGADGGELAAAVLTGGVAHPPGYPLYLVLGRLVQYLPGPTPFARLVWLSLIPAWLAAMLVGLWVAAALGGPARWRGHLAGWASALLLGTGALYSGQAVIVEVYGLQAIFVGLALWAFYDCTREAPRFPVWVWLVLLGAGMGAHLTNVLLLVPWIGLWIAAMRAGDRVAGRHLVGGLALAGTVGVGLYLLVLPLRARGQPPVNWGNPVTLQGLWWLVSGQVYRGLLFGAPPDVLLERIAAWPSLLREQFGLVGMALGVVGALNVDLPDRRWNRVLLWLVGAYSLFALSYYSFDSIAYLLPAFMAYAAWVGMGLFLLSGYTWRNVPVGALAAVGVLLWGLARIPAVGQAIAPDRPPSAEAFASRMLERAPQQAILITSRDQDTFPLWYYHYGLGERPDLALVVAPMINMTWYRDVLAYTYPSLHVPDAALPNNPASLAGALAAANPGRPVCTSIVTSLEPVEIETQCPKQTDR